MKTMPSASVKLSISLSSWLRACSRSSFACSPAQALSLSQPSQEAHSVHASNTSLGLEAIHLPQQLNHREEYCR